jgi:hypothetical protein
MKISSLTTEPFHYHALDFLFRVGNIHIALRRLIYGNLSALRSLQALATHIGVEEVLARDLLLESPDKGIPRARSERLPKRQYLRVGK